ncbi:MAG: ATP-binding cassette domain-containing protein [Lachnospiraceae bacterium]|nr:ATP-binding cassette domain-containing protein [Lachnospiraceae bacterium]
MKMMEKGVKSQNIHGLKYNKTNVRLIIGICLLSAVVLLVVFSLLVEIYDPNEVNYSEMLKKPSLKHIFGTDDYGRDIFTRVMRGAATTFGISLFTVAMGAAVGTVVGALTGYFGGIVDEILMRVNDCLASFPSILLALVVVSLLDKGTWNICIALGIVFIPSFARIMRAEFLKEKNKDYVLNARLMGASHFRIIFKHIFPNTLPILFSGILVGINNAVLAEAGLSYLGLGVQPPDPSLGRMLSEAKTFLLNAPWYELYPCLVMILFILGLTLISDNFGVSGVSLRSVKKKNEKLRENAQTDIREESGNKDTGNITQKGNKKNGNKKTESGKSEGEIIISVKNLEVGFIEDDGIDDTLYGISFDLHKGEVLGVVGESGSGKSLTAMSIMGTLSEKAVITGGSIILDGKTDLTKLPEEEYRKLRGGRLAYVFQEPMTSLNPVQKIGVQIDEILDIHSSNLPEAEQKKLVLEALKDTGLHDVEKLYEMYPHELSGGMRQRVCIAMALVAKADVILADEPTTALDANVADVILDIFKHINRKYGTAIMLISHDLRVIGKLADRVLIMQDGNIVETMELPEEKDDKVVLDKKKASVIKDDAEMYRFRTPETEYGRKLLSAAFSTKRYNAKDNAGKTSVAENKRGALVRAENLSISYKNRSWKKRGFNKVVKEASFEIPEGITAGFVGESGSGKSTLVKAIAGLQKYVEGKLEIKCESPGMVFQDPYSSLNPAFPVKRILEEPFRLKKGWGWLFDKEYRVKSNSEIEEILDKIELEKEILDRKISELSGGQRQRIAIALTLIQKKKLIILDEPVSALDVTIQEQILDLIMKLKEEYALTYILISHDLRLVSRVCDIVYKIEKGKVSRQS